MPYPYIILETAVERCQPFDTPAVRATDRTTSHLTKPANNAGKVIGYQGERPPTKLVTTPFVLSALRSKAYRSMSGVATAVSRFNTSLRLAISPGLFIMASVRGLFITYA